MLIELEDISKRFVREWIIRGCTLSFEPGKSYAITGPNGSGKSTLAQLLCGYVTPTSGVVKYRLDGGEISADHVYQHLSFASPYMELIEEFTLDELLKFHFKFKRPMEGVAVPEMKKLMNLEGASDKQVWHFSSGMKQRLKLGLAFFSDCQLMIFDEPTTNLDETGVSWFLEKAEQLGKDKIIVVCSNQAREYSFCSQSVKVTDYK